MHVYRLDDFTRGWFVGDFNPAALKTGDVEVGVRHYAAGDEEAVHHHPVAKELTVVVFGRVEMFGREFGTGNIVEIEPGESTGFKALTDAVTVVVKVPSVKNDKYPG